MPLFLNLVLSHLIADFILQFEELYRLKVRSHLGHFLHAFTHLIVMLVLSFPFIQNHLWIAGYILILAIIHHFQDVFKYGVQAKHPKQIFWCFTLDQMGHFLFLSTALLIPLQYQTARLSGISWIDAFYSNHWIVLFFIAFIAATFKMTYFLHAFRLSFIPNSRPLHFITSFEVAHAIVERTWMTGWIIFAPLSTGLPVAFAVVFLRFFSPQLRNTFDFILSAASAVFIGFLFRGWLG